MQKPALSLAAMPGRRRATLELGAEIERRGFGGIYCPTFGDGLALCGALAFTTRHLRFGTSIANIYTRHPWDYAQTASFLHEISDGRFRFGIGVSHTMVNEALGIQPGRPIADMRRFVADVRAAERRAGKLPPIVLATLRRKMVQLAAEIADGAVWANAARSHMAASLGALGSKAADESFFIGNMIPTCLDNDRAAAAAVMRRALRMYVQLPNYQEYWVEAGYEEEMQSIRRALAAGEKEQLDSLMTDRWLEDVTLFGSKRQIREGLEAWEAAGVRTPILVPSSTGGGQLRALEEIFAVFDD